jgi:hypothetical protein
MSPGIGYTLTGGCNAADIRRLAYAAAAGRLHGRSMAGLFIAIPFMVLSVVLMN